VGGRGSVVRTASTERARSTVGPTGSQFLPSPKWASGRRAHRAGHGVAVSVGGSGRGRAARARFGLRSCDRPAV